MQSPLQSPSITPSIALLRSPHTPYAVEGPTAGLMARRPSNLKKTTLRVKSLTLQPPIHN
jgi:hypothetical protein